MNRYTRLLKDFVSQKISALKFEQNFLELFKAETSFSSKRDFLILDKLFGDVDAYCSNPDLIEDPEFEITEEELRLSAKEALDKLGELAKI